MTEDSAVDATLVVEPQRFAVVPEWIIAADVSDSAFRLYVVLLRYGSTSGIRMPCRSTSLASRLHKNSVDTVNRALKELQALGAVTVDRRRDGERWLTNRYHVRTSPPGRADAATPRPERQVRAPSGRTDAATPGRRDAAGVAAPTRPDREPCTENPPPPAGPTSRLSPPAASSCAAPSAPRPRAGPRPACRSR